jgi:hypothetical protein
LAGADREGLGAVIGRRDAGRLVHQGLALRIAALIAFFISDDYARLRDELLTQPES